MSNTDRAWSGTSWGGDWLLRLLIFGLRIFDVRIFYVIMAVFVIPVTLLVQPSRRTSYDFLRRRCGKSPLRAAWGVYVNHCLFGQVVLDRFAMYAGQKYKISTEHFELFESLSRAEGSFAVLSAHVGAYELAGYGLKANKRMNSLVYPREKETVMRGRHKLFDANNINMIAVQDDMSHLYEIEDAVRRGEAISMPADRVFGSRKTIGSTLMGEDVQLPQGPFRIVTMHSLPCLTVNVVKESSKAYRIYIDRLDYDTTATRKEQMSQLADSYTSQLEHLLKNGYAEQWYNFYDFWKANVA